MKYAWLALGMMCLLSVDARAGDITKLPMNCKQTPAVATLKYPGENSITTINNLATPPGKSEAAAGQLIMFSGRVVDLYCVPVVGASVELWQADPYGKTVYPDAGSLTGPEPKFAGAGRAYTNNQGRFTFVSVFPGGVGKDAAPKLNVRISHPLLAKAYTTSLYFSGERRNAADPVFKRVKDLDKEAVLLKVEPGSNGMLVVTKDIVVTGNDARKGF